MDRPHPDDFTVDIRERGDGTWSVQVREMPELRAEGETLRVTAHEVIAMALTAFGRSRNEAVRGYAVARAVEQWVEDYLDGVESEKALEEGDFVPWEEVKEELGL